MTTRPLIYGSLLAIILSPVLLGDTASWINTGSDYWTNNANWNPATGHPGTNAANNAFLTNAVAGSYTNILNADLANPLTNLIISNRLGEAWLNITNTTLRFTTGTLGANARIRFDGGGMLTGATLLVGNNAFGTNAAVEVRGAGTVLKVGTTLRAGVSGTSNRLSVLDGAVVVANNATIGFGAGAGENLFYLENGASLTNSGVFSVGSSGGFSNRAYLGGAGAGVYAVFGGQVHVGNGGNWNRLILSNATFLVGSDRLTVGGGGGASNEFHVLKDAAVNAQNFLLLVGEVGSGQSTAGNQLLVDGGVVTNASSLNIGRAYNSNNTNTFNSVTLTNGASMQINGEVAIGRAGNTTLVTAPWSAGNELVAAGSATELNVGGNITLGQSTHVGHSTTSNRLVVTDGALVTANTVTVGLGAGVIGSSNNSVLVKSGGVLQAHSLVTGGSIGSGNIISNFGGVFQFTNSTPVITPGTGAGSIAIDSGAISFRNITNADVFANQGGTGHTLTNITFAGDITFQLNAASNRTDVTQTYTFDSVANTGQATNFQALVMVNGHTAFRGGNLTIGTGGSALFERTTATVTGLFTNHGTATLVDSTATFAGNFVNTATGTLAGRGTLVGQLINAGTVTPGLSVGSLTNIGNVTFTATSVAVMEIAGVGDADLLFVQGDLTLTGQLEVVLLDGFVPGEADSFDVMKYTGSIAGDAYSFTNVFNQGGVPTVYAYANGDLAGTFRVNVGTGAVVLDQFVVIPEPSALILVLAGLGLLAGIQRKRSARCDD